MNGFKKCFVITSLPFLNLRKIWTWQVIYRKNLGTELYINHVLKPEEYVDTHSSVTNKRNGHIVLGKYADGVGNSRLIGWRSGTDRSPRKNGTSFIRTKCNGPLTSRGYHIHQSVYCNIQTKLLCVQRNCIILFFSARMIIYLFSKYNISMDCQSSFSR